MKRIFAMAILAAISCGMAFSQSRKVSILGDSYSTYKGYIPPYYDVYYPTSGCDVNDVHQTCTFCRKDGICH